MLALPNHGRPPPRERRLRCTCCCPLGLLRKATKRITDNITIGSAIKEKFSFLQIYKYYFILPNNHIKNREKPGKMKNLERSKCLILSGIFLAITHVFLRKFKFFQWLNPSSLKNQAIKGGKRGIFPFSRLMTPRPPYGARAASPFRPIGICRGAGVRHRRRPPRPHYPINNTR